LTLNVSFLSIALHGFVVFRNHLSIEKDFVISSSNVQKRVTGF